VISDALIAVPLVSYTPIVAALLFGYVELTGEQHPRFEQFHPCCCARRGNGDTTLA